ncbi:glycosyltransferase family 9 protein [Luteimonas sp. A611]
MSDTPAPPAPGTRGPLLVRLCNWVGEVVLSVPAIRRLSLAGYSVHLYGKRWAPALLEGLALPVTVRDERHRLAIGQLRQVSRAMRAHEPGSRPGALLFTRSISSAVETRLAGFRPVGYAYDGRQLFLHEAYPRPRGLHMGEEYWRIVNAFLREDLPFPSNLDLVPSAGQTAAASALLAQAGIATGSYVVLCPFSGSDDRADRKVWPGFADITRHLLERGRTVVVCPGPGEEDAARARTPGAILFPGVDLGIYSALLALSHAAVSNDTGPGHIAAGVGARLVSIHGPPSTAAWAPVGPQVTLFPYAGRWASVEEVAQALR